MTESAESQLLSLELSSFSIKFVPARFWYSFKAASKSDWISGDKVEDAMLIERRDKWFKFKFLDTRDVRPGPRSAVTTRLTRVGGTDRLTQMRTR